MTEIIPGNALTKVAVASMLDDCAYNAVSGTYTSSVILGDAFARLYFHWPTFHGILGERDVAITEGVLEINNTVVSTPTTYYIYVDGTSDVPVMTKSTISPVTNLAIPHYFLVAIVRFVCSGMNIIIHIAKNAAQEGSYGLLHNVRENCLFENPIWVEGLTINISATGQLSTTSGYVRYGSNEPRAQAEVNQGGIALDNESVVADINAIQTYADGTAITAGKYHKLLVGIIRNNASLGNKTEYVVMRQSKPTTEYDTSAAAIADAESKAATSFPTAYFSSITPIYYLVTQKGNWAGAGATIIDIRATGLLKGGSSGSVTTSHHILQDLTAYDDHSQYLRTDGGRALSGNWNAGTATITTTGNVSGSKLISTVAQGTAPLTVSSSTVVTNLNADKLDGLDGSAYQPAGTYIKADGTVGLSADWNAGAYVIGANVFKSNIAPGTAPLNVTSPTVVPNLNADMLDGKHASEFIGAFNGVTNGDAHDHVGGDGAQIDHSQTSNLLLDSHTQYLKADGTRALTGNMAVDANITIDGVDISAHAANANAHHNAITLSTAADTVLQLNTQQIDLDIQNAGYVLAGPLLGSGPVKPTFRRLGVDDIATPNGALIINTATNHDVPIISGYRVYYVSFSGGFNANFEITGFTNGVEGAVLYIFNGTGKVMTLANDNTGSSVGNRIYNSVGTFASNHTVTLVYIGGTVNHWCVVG